MQLNQQFLDFLQKTPGMLEKFMSVMSEFLKIQGQVNIPDAPDADPVHPIIGDDPVMNLPNISNAELDALAQDMATAEVKEKFYQFVKGFIMGAMMRGA